MMHFPTIFQSDLRYTGKQLKTYINMFIICKSDNKMYKNVFILRGWPNLHYFIFLGSPEKTALDESHILLLDLMH